MAWLVLIGAGLCEIGWAVGLKYTEGFSRPGPTLVTLVAILASIVLLAFALRDLPLGTAYAVWTGIGTIGTTLFGILVLHEASDPLRLLCIALIAGGIIGLKLVTP